MLDPYLTCVASLEKGDDGSGRLVQIALERALRDPDLILQQDYLSVNGSPPSYCLITSNFLFVLDDPISTKLLDYQQLHRAHVEVKLVDGALVLQSVADESRRLTLRANATTDLRAWANILFGLLGETRGAPLAPHPSPSPSRIASTAASSGPIGLSTSPSPAPSTDAFQVRARIFVWSWNMAARNPDLAASDLNLSPDFHIYVFGVQECPDGALFRLLHQKMKTMGCCRLPLHAKHERIYGRGDGAIFHPKFTGMIVYARRTELARVKIVRTASCATGKGSKGAVAVLLDVFGVSVAIICAHLSSESLAKRRRDLARIFAALSADLALGDGRHFDLADQFDHCIFFGDLNFRVTGVTVPDVVLALQTNSIATLSDADELDLELRQDRSLFGFVEPRRTFLPTYKLNRDRPRRWSRSDWPLRRYTLHFKGYWYKSPNQNPIRIPSWCDRILFANGTCCGSLLIPKTDDRTGADCYDVYDDGALGGSDHETIYAAFDLLLARSGPDPTSSYTIFFLCVTIHDLTICSLMRSCSFSSVQVAECRAMLRRSSLMPSASERFPYVKYPFQLFCASQSEADPIQLMLQVTLTDGTTGSCRFLLQNADRDDDQMRILGPLPLSSGGSALRHSVTDVILSLKAAVTFTYHSIR